MLHRRTLELFKLGYSFFRQKVSYRVSYTIVCRILFLLDPSMAQS